MRISDDKGDVIEFYDPPETSNPSRCAELTGSGRGIVVANYSVLLD